MPTQPQSHAPTLSRHRQPMGRNHQRTARLSLAHRHGGQGEIQRDEGSAPAAITQPHGGLDRSPAAPAHHFHLSTRCPGDRLCVQRPRNTGIAQCFTLPRKAKGGWHSALKRPHQRVALHDVAEIWRALRDQWHPWVKNAVSTRWYAPSRNLALPQSRMATDQRSLRPAPPSASSIDNPRSSPNSVPTPMGLIC